MPLLISLSLLSFLNILIILSLKVMPSVFFSYQRAAHLTLREDVISSVARTVSNAYNLSQQTVAHRQTLNSVPPPQGPLDIGLAECRLRDLGPPEQDLSQGNPVTTPNGVDLCMPEDLVLQDQRYCENYSPPFDSLSYCFSFGTEASVFASFKHRFPSFSMFPKAFAQTLYFEGARPAPPVMPTGFAAAFDISPAREGMDASSLPLRCDSPNMDCISVLICLRGQSCEEGSKDLVLITLLLYP